MYDLIIVGSGPAGLAAALTAKRHGLDFLMLERGVLANTIYGYPVARPLFSTSDEVELDAGALPRDKKPTREDVLDHYEDVVAREHLNIKTGCEVSKIIPTSEGISVETADGNYRTRAVLVAVGGFGRKRKLDVPGEDDSRVSYSFVDAAPWANKDVLVIGGGNSAAEAALFLADAGANVTLSIRRPALDVTESEIAGPGEIEDGPKEIKARIKPWVRKPLEEATSKGLVKLLASSKLVEIGQKTAMLSVTGAGSEVRIEIPCDHIFALIGADPDTRLLEDAGVEIARDGRPVYDIETCKTNVPGIYVAGHITREMHMKNAIKGAERVVALMASKAFEKGLTS
ncbi:MAG TPA: NAD(P)-binding domain-containing protein [Blastocatellia bacterium]|jgi:thioredoxin reductase (NADPH)|nr:NAD(P)-binding domain-containing protein [Blastocatellia bacterium]